MAAVRSGFEDESAVPGLVSGHMHVARVRPERVAVVVRTDLEVPRGNHEAFARKARGERGAATGCVRSLLTEPQVVPLGVRPPRPHQSGQFLGDP